MTAYSTGITFDAFRVVQKTVKNEIPVLFPKRGIRDWYQPNASHLHRRESRFLRTAGEKQFSGQQSSLGAS
jgi:hypothetical protein